MILRHLRQQIVEPFEDRVAPALFLSSAIPGDFETSIRASSDSSAKNRPGEDQAVADSGAAFGFLLNSGDRLVLDATPTSSIRSFSAGAADFALNSMKAGSAIVFLTDNNVTPASFDNGDQPLDGLVIVRTGRYQPGISTTAPPLLVVAT